MRRLIVPRQPFSAEIEPSCSAETTRSGALEDGWVLGLGSTPIAAMGSIGPFILKGLPGPRHIMP